MLSVFLKRPSAGSLDRHTPVKRFLLFWTPAIVGVVVIAIESQATFSAANTSTWLRPIWEWIFGPISTPVWEEFHHILRKTGHFAGYGTLCVLFLRGWLLTFASNPRTPLPVWRRQSWLCSIASTFLVASGDEWHQSLLPSRTGTFSDVVLDTCGGIAVSGMVLAVNWWMRRAFDQY